MSSGSMICAACHAPVRWSDIAEDWFHAVPEDHPSYQTIVREVIPDGEMGTSGLPIGGGGPDGDVQEDR